MAIRNDNPMPYKPGNSAEARLLLETLARDWTEQLLSDNPDWGYLDDLSDWIEEARELMEEFELWENLE